MDKECEPVKLVKPCIYLTPDELYEACKIVKRKYNPTSFEHYAFCVRKEFKVKCTKEDIVENFHYNMHKKSTNY